eukprot:13619836-Alexandrium_andersonii.AAC.1
MARTAPGRPCGLHVPIAQTSALACALNPRSRARPRAEQWEEEALHTALRKHDFRAEPRQDP